jgi:riboflavin kinase/FMN adenylyltransferase
MRIFKNLAEIKKDDNTVLTIGTFDGIHLGHQKIIKTLKKKSEKYGCRSLLITFNTHPANVLSGGNNVKCLSTLQEKIELVDSMGIENLFIINFTREFSQLSAENFIKDYILQGTGVKEIIIGYDHHFGKGRGGSVNTLKKIGVENNFNVISIDAVELNGEKVSSTNIRKALADGNIQLANSYLGRYYSFAGKVVEGDKRGRELGFPTANISLSDEQKLLPEIGIYTVEIYINKRRYFGLLSIGRRPTFHESGAVIPEVYIYDFDENIYGCDVTVNVIERIRGEEKFNSAEELIIQMNKDKDIGLEILSRLAN